MCRWWWRAQRFLHLDLGLADVTVEMVIVIVSVDADAEKSYRKGSVMKEKIFLTLDQSMYPRPNRAEHKQRKTSFA